MWTPIEITIPSELAHKVREASDKFCDWQIEEMKARGAPPDFYEMWNTEERRAGLRGHSYVLLKPDEIYPAHYPPLVALTAEEAEPARNFLRTSDEAKQHGWDAVTTLVYLVVIIH